MALRLSTGFRNARLGKGPAVSAATISFDQASSQILDSDSGFGSFQAGDLITVTGTTNNNGRYILSAATVGALTVKGSLTDESAGTTFKVKAHRGGSFRDIMRDGVIRVYSGAQPSSADDAETGTLLCKLTLSSGTFVAGEDANGLELGESASGIIGKEVGEVWSGENLASGTAGWFRWYSNSETTGASTSAVRLDGACGTSGAEMVMGSTSLSAGVDTTVNSVQITQPAS